MRSAQQERLGVESALGNLRDEVERDMKLMGIRSLKELTPNMVRRR